MLKNFLIIASLLVLNSCSYLVDESNQDITFLTPGAENAVCYAYIDKVKYRVRPPQTINVFKSKYNLDVDCLAPGNRRKQVVVEPKVERSYHGNVLTGIIPGTAWDYASGAMFRYPDTIEIDFTNVLYKPESMPAQNKPDVRPPEDIMLEEFRPGRPLMNSDKYSTQEEIRKREIPEGSMQSEPSEGIMHGPVSDKGDLQSVIDNATNSGASGNGQSGLPQAAPVASPDVMGPPIPLFPGQ